MTVATERVQQKPSGGGRGWRSTTTFAARYGLLLLLIAECLVFSLLLPDTFATIGNVRSIVSSQAIVLLLTIALAFPLRSNEFDVSVAGLMVATGAVSAVLMVNGVPVILAVLAGLGLGALVGLINALLIVKVGVNSFVTTLGMMTALGGVAYAVSNSTVVVNLPPDFVEFGRFPILGLQSIVWIGWLVALIAWYVFERMPYGRYLLFIGGSPSASKLAGVPVDRVKTSAFLVCSLIGSFAGILLIANVGQMDPSVGGQFLLQPFAGVFLGATAITVGRVNILGAVIAIYVLEVGITGLQLLGAQPWVSDVFNGVALVTAVTLSVIAARSRRKA